MLLSSDACLVSTSAMGFVRFSLFIVPRGTTGPALTRPPSDETGQSDDPAWNWGVEFLAQLLNRAAEHRSATKFGAAGMRSPNDEVERRAVASTKNEAALYKSSTPSLANRKH